ncbi:hypothetical protein K523DRAFT_356060 [Schizophyllum commune Tattone D]|nr:hypothetical protein K523DRAFT_356060 [Schizophyllum commune Tattone D]
MIPFTFLSDKHQLWAERDEEGPKLSTRPRGTPVLNVSLELQLMIFDYLSPYDLYNARQVCTSWKVILDDTPSVWRHARQSTHNTPPPPTGHTEWAWAGYIFVGTLDAATKLCPDFATSYGLEWRKFHNLNIAAIKSFLKGNRSADITDYHLREWLRSPTLRSLLDAFRRDLRVIDAVTWHASLWAMERELGLISLCNLARAPTNFQFFPSDRIFCTICHPDTTSAREAMKAQPGKHQKLSWFKQNTVRVDQLTDHYEKGHKEILLKAHNVNVPELGLYAICPACMSRPTAERPAKRAVFTAPGLMAHNDHFHGVVNPWRELRWSCN